MIVSATAPVLLGATQTTPKLGVHQLFEATAARSPTATALIFGNESLSYAQLNVRANQLAHALLANGVQPGGLVALLVPRSIDMAVAVLAILKTGAAYVPLDADYPDERLAHIVSDCAAAAVLTTEALSERLPDHPRLLCLDDASAQLDSRSASNPDIALPAQAEAYCIYTSGSTGAPKGARIFHSGAVNLYTWFAETFGFTASTRFIVLSSIGHDITQKGLIAPWLVGGAAVLLETPHYDAGLILDTIARHQVTSISCVPTALYGLLDHADEASLQKLVSLRAVFPGGEPLYGRRLLAWQNHPSCQCAVINTYGPTETTDLTSTYPVKKAELDQPGMLPIGSPIANTALYVLDAKLHPVPGGEPGELCIAGALVGGGYINRPELDAEKFVQLANGDVLYRSGDIVRLAETGVLHYVSRLDHQVKVRGYRVELAELEAALALNPKVLQAVVTVLADKSGENGLHAYLRLREHSNTSELRQHAAQHLPDYFLPQSFTVLERFPLNASNKVDRKALPAPKLQRPNLSVPYSAPQGKLQQQLAQLFAEQLGFERIGVNDPFFELGGNSLQSTQLIAKLSQQLAQRLPIASFFAAPTVAGLAQTLLLERPSATAAWLGEATPVDALPATAPPAVQRSHSNEAIAIVGLSFRGPGANDANSYWQNLVNGSDSLRELSNAELDAAGVDASIYNAPGYVRRAGVMAGYDQFDHAFFGLSPREAELADPQQRVLLEAAWHAFEDAGLPMDRGNRRIGVFAGVARNSYFMRNLASHPELRENTLDFHTILGSDKDYAATRIAYKLDLRGPALSVQTACSSSGVALHLACQSLRSGDCDAALAGGASIPVPLAGYQPFDGGPLAQDGVLRPFDAQASGMVLTAGVACLVLKRLGDAQASGDRIYAVIKGSGLANDGAQKLAYTAPSVRGIADAASAALAAAQLTAEQIGYVEAHGTGTLLGDPIEAAGLSQAWRAHTQALGVTALGSVKGNIGHLDAAAAAASVVKVAQALYHGVLPASLHFSAPNPECDFAHSPFYVNSQTRAWPQAGIARAGVASAGFGGTNFHAILEAVAQPPAPLHNAPALLRLSAKTDAALGLQMAALCASPLANLPAAAYTLDTRRTRLPRRAFALAQPGVALAPQQFITGSPLHAQPSVVFAFPGQGAQHPGMGQQLYETQPVFRAAVDECAEILSPLLKLDLRQLLFPTPAQRAEAAEQLKHTQLAQPAIFIISYATAQLWLSTGVKPAALIGHSVGEFVAATLAGVFRLQDALALLAARGRLMQSMPAGGMLAVRLSEAELAPYLGTGLDLAAINAPKLCVVSGAHSELAALNVRLIADGVGTSELHTSHAFHSAAMQPVLAPFSATVAGFTRNPPQLPIVSTRTGQWLTAAEATSPDYWAGQLRHTVRFAPALETLFTEPGCVLIECGPGQNLSTSARQTARPSAAALAVPSLPHAAANADDAQHWQEALGRAWLAGVEADPSLQYPPEARQVVSLPSYPFAPTRHWVNAIASGSSPLAEAAPLAASSAAADAAPPDRAGQIQAALAKLLADLTGMDFDGENFKRSFLEQGLDSLMLTQVAGKLKNVFKVEVKFRQLMEELTSPIALAEYLTEHAAGIPGVTAGAAKAQSVTAPEAGTLPAAPAKVFGAGTRINKSRGDGLSERQQASFQALSERYLAKTPQSKAFAQKHRAVLADPRTVSGFRPLMKELTYPLVTPRSEGAYLWDLDGNQYIDITNGFGCVFFGHRPKFVEDAVAAQLKNGWEIGPQTPLAGECADYISKFTGLPRVAFCATGSEAVLAAMRTARTVTGRNLIVMHNGDYHGVFDEVIVRGTPSLRSVPAGAGIPQEAVANTLILDYSSEKTLQILKERGDEIAAVIIEPVQSRRPDWQPREYMHEVRRITNECGAAMIMDEVVTGFRAALGGAQEYFGVQADLASYGKVVGGGLPIGVVAGIPKYMDALDGGMWQFGDDSVPEVGVTYFAGTFVRHPLAMAAALAVCKHLEANPHLQVETTRRTQRMVDVINTDLIKAGAPLHIAQFTSLFKPEYTTDQTHGDLLYAFLREAGIHVWDARPCFLTTAHTDADCERIIDAFRYAVSKMQEGGFFEGGYQAREISFEAWRSPYGQPLPGARIGRDAHGNPAWFVKDPSTGRWQTVEMR